MQHAFLFSVFTLCICLISGCSIQTGTDISDTIRPIQQNNSTVRPQDEPLPTPPRVEKKVIPLDGRAVKTTIKEIVQQGKPASCTFSQDTEDGRSFVGIVYISGSNIRVATKGTVGGKSVTMNMLLDDGFIHTRTSLEPGIGYKIKDTTADEKQHDDTADVGIRDTEMTFVCSGGAKTDFFSLPQDVNFQTSSSY